MQFSIKIVKFYQNAHTALLHIICGVQCLDVKGQICRKKLVVMHLSSKQKYYLQNCIKNRSQGFLWRSIGQDSTFHCRGPEFILGLETSILQVMWHGLYRQIDIDIDIHIEYPIQQIYIYISISIQIYILNIQYNRYTYTYQYLYRYRY